MNIETKEFIDKLKLRTDVLGVIMFGSWARGNNRPDSDVDLVVILADGYERTVEYLNKQAFEIIYTTEKRAFDYWESHMDNAANLWKVAKVLFDKGGAVKRLESKTKRILSTGKKPTDECQIGQFHFDAEDQLRYAKSILSSDSTTANLILTNKVSALTELFFDLRQMWTPAPKQRLAVIKNLKPKLYFLLQDFYKEQVAVEKRIQTAKEIVLIIFDK